MRKIINAARVFGFDINRAVSSVRGLPNFLQDFQHFSSQCETDDEKPKLRHLKPMLADRYASAGSMGDYFLQDLWAARKIYESKPKTHADVGSRIDGFIGALLTFMDVEVVDVRPLASKVVGLSFTRADATNLSCWPSGSRESLSSLHAAEHFGLGRYGDPVDPKACFRAMAELRRVLAPGGSLYFSVPVGAERIEFNAHRVFSPSTILRHFSDLDLRSFSLIDEHFNFYEAATIEQAEGQRFRTRFGIGLFHFVRPAA